MITEEELTHLLDRLLEVGVPPSAIAKAWDIDPFLVKDRMNDLRIGRYGNAEMSEALANVQWEMLEEFRSMIHDAPYTERARFITAMVGKTMSLTARQNPEMLGNMRNDLLQLYQAMQASDDSDELLDEDTSAFVAVAATDDDQDQGPDD